MAFYENTIVAKQDLAEKELKDIKNSTIVINGFYNSKKIKFNYKVLAVIAFCAAVA